jgi:hypothetical protein
MLFSVKAAISIPLYILIIPATLQFLVQRMNFTKPKATLWCARLSIYCLIAGSLGIGLAASLPWLVLGKLISESLFFFKTIF